MLGSMIDMEPTLTKSNIDMLVNYVEALTPPASTPAGVTPAEAYRDGYMAAQAAARRLVLDMWKAAEIVFMAANDVYGDDDD